MRDWKHPAYKTCHFGVSGIGKTTHFLSVLNEQEASYYFIFDHKREFAHKLGAPVAEGQAQIVEDMVKMGAVFFDYHTMFPGDRESGFRFFAKFVYGVAGDLRGRKIFVADEIQEVAGPDDDCSDLITLMDDGRTLKIDAMLIAQSPNGVHTLVRNQLTEIFAFRQSDENATKHLEKNSFNGQALRTLRPGEWLWRNLNTGASARGGRAFEIDCAGIPTGGTLIGQGEPEERGYADGD